MIIKVDNSNAKHYEKLFTDAYEVLREAGKIAENEIGRLTSLEEFFSHIADIYSADRSFLIKLPVDEPTLAIDANKRTIDTTLFNRTANVQSDEVAEIAIFSIDRYYDYMDLATAEIWVQWTAPGLDGLPREGATLIEMKDVETEPGKLRFGWPLDSDITAVPGNVQFAVRFFKRGVVDVPQLDGSIVKENKIIYSLNTLPASVRISNALQPELNAETELNKPQGLFTYAIVNSVYTGKDVLVPQTPSFAAPGLDLPVTATLKDDELELRAQAVVGDTGTIRYEWYYTPVGSDIAKNVETEGFGTVGVAYVEIDGSKEILSERYYVKVGGAYEEYKDGFPAAEDVVLYEKFTTFKVPTTGDVTGTYQVKAINSVNVNTNEGNKAVDGAPQMSYPCILVSPSIIIIKEDLPAIAVMTVPEGSETGVASTTLKVVVDKPADDNSVYTYDWKKSLTKDGELVSINGYVDNNTHVITDEPGWYSVTIKSHLNRQTNEGESLVRTKVTFMPTAPIITYDEANYKASADDEALIYVDDIKTGDPAVLEVLAQVANAGSDPDLYGDDNLYSEKLSYQWIVTEPDKDPRPLRTNEITAGSIESNTVTLLKDGSENLYTCVVTNTLNEQTASDQLVFEIR